MTCLIGIADLDDVFDLARLEEASFDTDKLSVRQYRYLINQPSAWVMVAKKDDVLIAGAVTLFRKNSRKARLYSLMVELSSRQQGVGQEVYHFIEHKLFSNHYHEIYLEVKKANDAAIYFYQKNGFVITHELEKFYEDGSSAFKMHKHLNKMPLK